MYTEKKRTWQDNWNNVIRYVLFQDEKLKELMLVPEGTDIMTFIKKYFIRDSSTDEILINEKVRVVVHDDEGLQTRNPYVKGKYKHFDIYVSKDVENTCGEDALRSRQVMIAQRLKELLLAKPVTQGLRFSYEDEYDMWTKTIGYKMYKVVFFYMTTV